MSGQKTSENNTMERVFAAILESCCKVIIIPLCQDNISQLQRRLESEQKRVPRSSDLSRGEVFAWMKRLGNLKKRSENLLATNENRAGFCGCISAPFDSYIAATLLEQWEKLDEEEPSDPVAPDNSTGPQLTRKSTAPIGTLDTELSLYQPINNTAGGRDDGERNYGDGNYGRNNIWVLDTVGFRGEGDQVTRDLLSKVEMAARNDRTAEVQSTHIRLVRSKSFEIIHEERLVVLNRRLL